MRARETVKKLEAVKTYGTIKQCGRRRQYRLAFALAAALGIVCCGTAAAASQPVFCPQAVAAGPDGSLVVTDCYSKVIWKVTGDERTVYAGKPGQEGLYGEPLGGYGDGTRSGMRMEEPWDIVPYGEGYAVSDRENHMVRYIDAQGSRTLAGRGREGYEDNRGGRALFPTPRGWLRTTQGICTSRTRATMLYAVSDPTGWWTLICGGFPGRWDCAGMRERSTCRTPGTTGC